MLKKQSSLAKQRKIFNFFKSNKSGDFGSPFLIFKMQVKIQKSCRGVVSICDSDLVGKYFEEGKFQLDVKESFYRGEEFTKEQVLFLIQKMDREDATFNVVGKESIQTAIEAGIIIEEGVKKIAGIPFGMVLL